MSLELYLDPDVVPLTVWPVARISDHFLIGCAEDHDPMLPLLNESCNYILKLQLNLASDANPLLLKDLECTCVRKNSIRLLSDRDDGTYLFGFPALGNPINQRRGRKILLSRTDAVPS